MIVSVSRRTDIPALYSEWFVKRLLAGEVLVPHPYNRKKVSRIELSPKTVDCFVFWTKNPQPMLPYLKMIERLGYSYCFEFTITDYGKDLEPNLPSMEEKMATFILLSERLGKNRVNLRFDPIIINDKYTKEYHLEKFEVLCGWLHNYTERCTISFVDYVRGKPFLEMEEEDMIDISKGLAEIADKYDLPLYTCCEKVDLSSLGIAHGACIDRDRIQKIVGYKLDVKKDRGQRKECGCAESVDIGMYHTCVHGCAYCYATGKISGAEKQRGQHDPDSPMLIGTLKGDEVIVDRKMTLRKDDQMSLFDFI